MNKRNVVSRIRQSIVNNGFPPKYPDRRWENKKMAQYTNCLAYALNSTYPDKSGSEIYGDLLRKLPDARSYSDTDVICAFEKFLKLLKISVKRTEYGDYICPNHYKIALCIKGNGVDFHLIRQNKSGVWSHKLGWEQLPKYLCGENENPKEEVEKCGYKIIAYYMIKQL